MENGKKTAVTVGKFDGLHAGHAELISKTTEYAKKYNLKSVVFSFCPSPAEFFSGNASKWIFSKSERRDLLLASDTGADRCVEYPFAKLADMPPETFIKKILRDEFNCAALIVGEGFRFGKERSGDFETLKRICPPCGIEAVPVPRVTFGGEAVSSSRIKKLLSEGDVPGANRLLGRKYFISGEVAGGKRIGRALGFPTVNIEMPDDKFAPRRGVYATSVVIRGAVYRGVTNIGVNPTVSGEDKIKCETFILDFNDDVYGERVNIFFNEFIRDEKKFDSYDELRGQIGMDAERAKKFNLFYPSFKPKSLKRL